MQPDRQHKRTIDSIWSSGRAAERVMGPPTSQRQEPLRCVPRMVDTISRSVATPGPLPSRPVQPSQQPNLSRSTGLSTVAPPRTYSGPSMQAKDTPAFRRPGWAHGEPVASPTSPSLATPDPEGSVRPQPVTPPVKSKKKRLQPWLVELIQYPFIAVGAVLAAYNATIGQWLVLAYIIYAVVLRRDSRVSFGLALGMLLMVPLFQILSQPVIAENAAIYTYELLAFGTLQAIAELIIRERRDKYKKVT